MAAKFLDSSDIASCKIQGFSDGCVPESVRPYPQASFCAKTSHNFIEADSGQPAVSLSGPIKGIKQWTCWVVYRFYGPLVFANVRSLSNDWNSHPP
jgi:hypothetical protein